MGMAVRTETVAVTNTTETIHGLSLASGRYELERLLGSGGTASVWLARDRQLDRPVAVKLLSAALAGDESYCERFRREALIAAGLWHPHLVPIYDFGESPRPFLVTQYIDGGSLAERLSAGRGFDGQPLVLARELLGALSHVHRAGIVHRDIKPGNVLIDGGGRALLTDFGIARSLDASTITEAGLVVGTLRYLAPENMRGDSASPRSDLYATGVLLADVLAACPEPRLDALVERLTAQDQQQRPASAAQALALIDGADASLPTSQRPVRRALPRLPRGVPRAEQPTRVRPRSPQPRALASASRAWFLGAAKRYARALATTLLVVLALASIAVAIAHLSQGAGSQRPVPRHTVPPAARLTEQLDQLGRTIAADTR
jgi:serine/threonine-protein kinase